MGHESHFDNFDTYDSEIEAAALIQTHDQQDFSFGENFNDHEFNKLGCAYRLNILDFDTCHYSLNLNYRMSTNNSFGSLNHSFHFRYIHLQLRAHFGRKGFEAGSFDYFSCSFLLFTFIKI